MHQKILILDFGSQYTQLIARRVRETNVYCEIHPCDVSCNLSKRFAPIGIILSGGPASVAEDETPRAPQIVFELGIPVLGICYGMQTMAAQLGGSVENAEKCVNSVTPKWQLKIKAAFYGTSMTVLMGRGKEFSMYG